MRDRPDHREVREGRGVWQKAPSVQPNSQWDPGSHFSPSRSWFLKNTLSTCGRPPLEVLSAMHHGHHVSGFLLQPLPLCLKASSGSRRMKHPQAGQARSAGSTGPQEQPSARGRSGG